MKELSPCSTHPLLVDTLENLHINMTSLQNKTKYNKKTEQNSAPCPKLHIFPWISEKCFCDQAKAFHFLRVMYSHFWGKILKIYAIYGWLITSDFMLMASLLKYAFMIKIAHTKTHIYRVMSLKQWFLVLDIQNNWMTFIYVEHPYSLSIIYIIPTHNLC